MGRGRGTISWHSIHVENKYCTPIFITNGVFQSGSIAYKKVVFFITNITYHKFCFPFPNTLLYTKDLWLKKNKNYITIFYETQISNRVNIKTKKQSSHSKVEKYYFNSPLFPGRPSLKMSCENEQDIDNINHRLQWSNNIVTICIYPNRNKTYKRVLYKL